MAYALMLINVFIISLFVVGNVERVVSEYMDKDPWAGFVFVVAACCTYLVFYFT